MTAAAAAHASTPKKPKQVASVEDDERDGIIRGSNLKLAQRHKKIVAGAFEGRKRWEPSEPTPGVVGDVAVSFITSSAIFKESRMTMELLDHGWKIPSTITAIMRLPQGLVAPQLHMTWSAASRTLECTFYEHEVPPKTPVVIILAGIGTPDCATPQAEMMVTLYEKLVVRDTVPPSTRGGQILDGPTAFVIPMIQPGSLSGLLRWQPFSCCPNATSPVTLSFQVNGCVPLGGTIRLELPPDGWKMDEKPMVSVMLMDKKPYQAQAQPATWHADQNTLEIELTNMKIPMKTTVQLTIANVTNPPNETVTLVTLPLARLTTLVPKSGGVIDGPTKVDVARISELREQDFALAKRCFDEEDVEKKASIPLEKLRVVLEKTGLKFASDELFAQIVLSHLPDPSTLSSNELTSDAFLNLFAVVYAPAYKFGQELRVMCGRGCLDRIRELVSRGCDLNAKDASGWSPLHYAADFNQLQVLTLLQELCTSHGIQLNVNARDGSGWTPLMCAAAQGHQAMVEQLIVLGADLELASTEGRTATHWAASCGRLAVVDVLAKAGASVNGVDRCGWTPLHVAMLHDEAPCARSLVNQHQASTTIADKLSHKSLDYCNDPDLAAELTIIKA